TFLVASYAIEYAQGLWPHMLAVALGMGAYVAAKKVRDGGAASFAALAGLLAGLAVGIRYQNLAFAVMVGAGLLLPPRGPLLRAAVASAIDIALPLFASAAINAARLGSWNPVSKGGEYLAVGHIGSGQLLLDALRSTWARVVDYSAWPPMPPGVHLLPVLLPQEAETGAFLLLGAQKKAWLLSSP